MAHSSVQRLRPYHPTRAKPSAAELLGAAPGGPTHAFVPSPAHRPHASSFSPRALHAREHRPPTPDAVLAKPSQPAGGHMRPSFTDEGKQV